jgi:hypothetical protein
MLAAQEGDAAIKKHAPVAIATNNLEPNQPTNGSIRFTGCHPHPLNSIRIDPIWQITSIYG